MASNGQSPQSSSEMEEAQRSAKLRLADLVGLLSEQECRRLLATVERVAAGDPFWEGDFGLLYNEYVKLRGFRTRSVIAGVLVKEDTFRTLDLIKTYPLHRQIVLPPAGDVITRLGEAILRRRSRREYGIAALSAEQLSTLLRYGVGVTAEVPAYGVSRLPLRTFPSHGGLQAPELYVAVRNVSGVPAGIYHYEVGDHQLAEIKAGDHSNALHHAAFDEEFVQRAAVVFIVTGYYERLRWKNGERAYRFMCIDSGFVGQNLYLMSEAMGLGACAVSGFAQDQIEELIKVDGKTEIPLFLLAVGSRSEGSDP
jgi:SagB-type dehydrogenase family enzyme